MKNDNTPGSACAGSERTRHEHGERAGVMPATGKWDKLERPERVASLDPDGVLARVGIAADAVVCDIGAGSGLFSFAAARLTREAVFAVDTDWDVLERLNGKAAKLGVETVIPGPVVAGEYDYPLDPGSVDVVLMVTVLHEIPAAERSALLTESHRILVPGGRVVVVDFKKQATPSGPPVEARLDARDVDALFEAAGFTHVAEQDFLQGENFYVRVYRS